MIPVTVPPGRCSVTSTSAPGVCGLDSIALMIRCSERSIVPGANGVVAAVTVSAWSFAICCPFVAASMVGHVGG